MDVAALQCLDCGVLDVLRRVVDRLAEFEVDDVPVERHGLREHSVVFF